MVTDTNLLKRLIQDMASSPFVQGTAQSCVDNLKKLILLKKFAVISDLYYDAQLSFVENALLELYNCELDRNTVELNIDTESKSADWLDSLTVYKGTNLAIIKNITNLVNNAYITNKSVKLFGIHVNETIHARVRSYNGEAFAIDLLDSEDNMYTITNPGLVSEIMRGRRFTFDTTYGLISIDCESIVDIANVLFAILQNKTHKLRYKVNFMAYSDIINMNKDISYDSIDIYNITGITEWLRHDNLDLQGPNGVVLFLEITAGTNTELSLLIVNRNTSEIELIVDDVKVQLDKYSSNLVQRLFVHTDENINGEIIVPYEIGEELIENGKYISFPFDIIEDNFIWTDSQEEDT